MAKTSHIWLIGILVLAFIFMAHPAIRFSEPIVQWDGISYYIPARVYAETLSLSAENPNWNNEPTSGFVKTLSDYPPLTYIALGIPLRIFGNDVVWLNGLYGAFLFVFHLFFLFLFLRKVTKSTMWSVIGTGIGALNIRLYFTFYAGMFPTSLGVVMTTPALYYAWNYLEKRKFSDLFFTGIFIVLLGLSYPQQTWLFALMLLCMIVGVYVEKKYRFQFHKPQVSIDKGPGFWTTTPFIIIFLVSVALFVKFALLAPVTNTFTRDFIHAMLFTFESAYPIMWQMPFLLDGPIIFLLFLGGCIWLLYEQRFKLLFPIVGVATAVLFGVLFIPDVWVRIYFFRYFIELSILMGIVATMVLAQLWKQRKLRKEIFFVTVFIFLFALVKLFAFFSFVQPAITAEEHAAADYVYGKEGKIFYYDNTDGGANFRTFFWVVTYSEPADYTYDTVWYSLDEFSLVVVGTDATLDPELRAQLRGWDRLGFGDVAVYER